MSEGQDCLYRRSSSTDLGSVSLEENYHINLFLTQIWEVLSCHSPIKNIEMFNLTI